MLASALLLGLVAGAATPGQAIASPAASLAAAPAVLPAEVAPAAPAAPAAAPAAQPKTVTFDQHSFMIDGRRVYLWAGEFHYYRLPSPDLWRDILVKYKAGGFNAVSFYFDWAYHSPRPGAYDFTGIRDVERLLDMAEEVGLYVIARPGPYINAEIDSGGFPAWLNRQDGRARSEAADYLAASDEWLSQINPILARHQITNGTGPIISYQVENEFYDGSAAARRYMTHLEEKARADGITVPLVGNHNNVYNTGAGALDVDMPDGYPQGFNCSTPTRWNGVGDWGWARSPGKPLGIGEFQGGAFDPWGGPGYDKCRELTGPEFQKVFYKHNIAQGATQQAFYMLFGGTSWGWQADPSQVYSSYDYGAAITEGRQLSTKYDEDKRIGYFTQAVAPLTKTDPLGVTPPTSSAIVDNARLNPDDRTQFHILRHANSTSTNTDSTHIALDLAAGTGYTYDDVDQALTYTGTWSHAGAEQTWTAGDYQRTESFSRIAGDTATVRFNGTGVRWISSKDTNHGIADVYLDGEKVATVDGYGPTKATQMVFYQATGLTDGPHTLTVTVTGSRNASAVDNYVVVDAIDVPEPGAANASYPMVPQEPGTAITFAGRDSKIFVANYGLGAQRLQYSTSEIMTHSLVGDRDVALLYGRDGQDGETVFNYAAEPTVRVLSGEVKSTWDAARGDLRLNYRHSGLARVLISGGGTRPMLLLLATDDVAATFWTSQTEAGPILVRGPYLLRGASHVGRRLSLTGDTAQAGDLEVFSTARQLSWNGRPLSNSVTTSGSRIGSLAGPAPLNLPELTRWRSAPESPETRPGFDDSAWRVADKMSSNSTTTPATLPVLFGDDYGFHYGALWYRGRFRATGKETGVNLSAITGRAGVFSVWLNGQFVGSSTSGRQAFTFPAGAVRTGADNVLSVLVENMGHNQDYNSNDTHKQARGLTGASLVGSPLAAISWRIQGHRGAGGAGSQDPIDTVRGPMNNGGLYGERYGWHLPGFPDAGWRAASLPATNTTAGVTWYRTKVRLDLPRRQDTSLGLRIDDDPSRHYRALIFVNGWQLGRYVNDVGPQHSFPIPAGILNHNGGNTVAIAVWNADASTGGLGTVTLESYGTQASPLAVSSVPAPAYQRSRYTVAAAPKLAASLTTPDTVRAGEAFDVSAAISVPVGARPAVGASAELAVPDGWNASATSATTVPRLAAGRTATVTWRVTPPAEQVPVAAMLAVKVGATQNGRVVTVADSRVVRGVPAAPTADTAVSALSFLSATNGWGPVERDVSNGEAAAGDGAAIRVGGTGYASGLGVHAPSNVAVYTGGRCTRLTAVVGVDDEVGDNGSVTFSVLADGVAVHTSSQLTGTSAGEPIDVDVTGADVVDLVVGDGGDGVSWDHADWADAKLSCG